jgi:hypothetical protein
LRTTSADSREHAGIGGRLPTQRLTIEDLREARGITLLREWLSPEQQAQFDASKCFDVVGCDSGKRYRIRHGTGMNVHEIDDAGRSWAGVLSHRDT